MAGLARRVEASASSLGVPSSSRHEIADFMCDEISELLSPTGRVPISTGRVPISLDISTGISRKKHDESFNRIITLTKGGWSYSNPESELIRLITSC